MATNKAFKADSQRIAFLVCLEFSGYGTIVYVQWWRRSLLNAALGDGQESSLF
ncbi:hypothetical protein NOZ11_004421 [Vibrio parahaemolyticus]|nr:hypothetical protein [Vibrio parahaemolyticus]